MNTTSVECYAANYVTLLWTYDDDFWASGEVMSLLKAVFPE